MAKKNIVLYPCFGFLLSYSLPPLSILDESTGKRIFHSQSLRSDTSSSPPPHPPSPITGTRIPFLVTHTHTPHLPPLPPREPTATTPAQAHPIFVAFPRHGHSSPPPPTLPPSLIPPPSFSPASFFPSLLRQGEWCLVTSSLRYVRQCLQGLLHSWGGARLKAPLPVSSLSCIYWRISEDKNDEAQGFFITPITPPSIFPPSPKSFQSHPSRLWESSAFLLSLLLLFSLPLKEFALLLSVFPSTFPNPAIDECAPLLVLRTSGFRFGEGAVTVSLACVTSPIAVACACARGVRRACAYWIVDARSHALEQEKKEKKACVAACTPTLIPTHTHTRSKGGGGGEGGEGSLVSPHHPIAPPLFLYAVVALSLSLSPPSLTHPPLPRPHPPQECGERSEASCSDQRVMHQSSALYAHAQYTHTRTHTNVLHPLPSLSSIVPPPTQTPIILIVPPTTTTTTTTTGKKTRFFYFIYSATRLLQALHQVPLISPSPLTLPPTFFLSPLCHCAV